MVFEEKGVGVHLETCGALLLNRTDGSFARRWVQDSELIS